MDNVPIIRYVPKSTSHLKFVACACATLYAILHYSCFDPPETGETKKPVAKYVRMDLLCLILSIIAAFLAFFPIFCRPKARSNGKYELCPLDTFSGFLAGGSLIVCAVLQTMTARFIVRSRLTNPNDIVYTDWFKAADRFVGLILLSVGAVYCFIFTFQTFEESRNMAPPKKKKKKPGEAEDGVVGLRYATKSQIVELVSAVTAVMAEQQLQNATPVHHEDVTAAVEEACAVLPPSTQTATVVCDADKNHVMGPNELPPSYNETIEPC